MGTTGSRQGKTKRKASDLIKHLPARNFHNGIRLAASLGLDLNRFVSFNFSLTACPDNETDLAFARLRASFQKWVTRPGKKVGQGKAAPTFVWVIENDNNCLNAHWLVHVPASRWDDFAAKLPKWLEAAAGSIYSDDALHITPVKSAMAAGRYMLKGLHPNLARMYEIRHSHQGWVTGKRIGHSKNIGPTQVRLMRRLGKHPPAQRWVCGKYRKAAIAAAAAHPSGH